MAVPQTRPIQSYARFGDVAHAPPNLAKIPKPRGFKDQGQAKPWARQAAANADGGVGAGKSGGGSLGKQGQQQQQQSKKKSRAGGKRKGAAGGGGVVGDEEGEEEQRQMEADAKKAQKRQMEEMRQRVQEAYSGLKKKRRAGQTQFVSRDL